MKPPETIPPPLPRPSASRPAWQVLAWLALLLGLLALARATMHFELPLPGCPLRETTGVPCPFCGSTRAFAALAGMDLAEAVRLNPFVSLAACLAAGVGLVALAGRPELADGFRHRLGTSLRWRWLLGAALLLNWLYLLLRLPR